uniref:Uncharacterized protein n=1 Tax=Glossina austeni TaxID=7395 RepID=A0A1A9VYJ3_GLOAU
MISSDCLHCVYMAKIFYDDNIAVDDDDDDDDDDDGVRKWGEAELAKKSDRNTQPNIIEQLINSSAGMVKKETEMSLPSISISASNPISNQETDLAAMSLEVLNTSNEIIQPIHNSSAFAKPMISSSKKKHYKTSKRATTRNCNFNGHEPNHINKHKVDIINDVVSGGVGGNRDGVVGVGSNIIKTSLSMTSLPPDEHQEESRDVIKAKLRIERPYNSLKRYVKLVDKFQRLKMMFDCSATERAEWLDDFTDYSD